MLPPQEKMIDEMFAKKVIATLNKQPQVSDKVANRLAIAREAALKQMKVSHQENSFFDKVVDKIKEVFSVQVLAGLSATATVCFAVLGFVVMDQENQLIFDDNIVSISTHYEKVDNFTNDIEQSLIADDEDTEI